MNIEPNVEAFIEKAIQDALNEKSRQLRSRLSHGCKYTESPIERLFYVAFKLLCEIGDMDGIALREHNGELYHTGVLIYPQKKIGKYRADFLVCYFECKDNEKIKPLREIVVELDGHEFHDKDERQRRNEKARDRFFQKNNMMVFHFTGSEVVKDPFKVASEVFMDLVGHIPAILFNSVW